MYKHCPDFHLKETGFAEQRALFDQITARQGTPPPVIDRDDLLADLIAVVEAWRTAVRPHYDRLFAHRLCVS